MLVYEFGKQNNKKIVLLHGGGLSWWNYQEVAHLLEKEYHVILPVLDGHANSEDAFLSIEENAKRIIQYIQMHFNGKVDLIGGLSLGAQIVVEILSQEKDICDLAIVESALLLPMKFTNKSVQSMLDMSYGLIAKPWFAKLQFKSLKIKEDLYDMYYQDTCKITKKI
jgi:pimeloyl-ACP methyl ester carboxylesterase